ncbi:hypothetical protein [Bergeriella denitrificans]|uniref:hypothetical protein n=1 Tax=Bergeriella denitrificans TaxID=494 RepID=UPI0011C07ED9|nr:hypothetical protein [Bergeriella denitrificans]
MIIAFGWLMVLCLFAISAAAFLWRGLSHLRVLRRREHLMLAAVFAVVAFQMFCIARVSGHAPDAEPDWVFVSLIGIPPLATGLLLFLFAQWQQKVRALNELVIVLGAAHVARMMVLADLNVPIYMRIVANMVYLILPSFAVYQMTKKSG